jgi:hypothetical protein
MLLLTCCLRYFILRILGGVAGIMLAFSIFAAPLEWSIDNPVVSANPGDTVVFSGVITNNTGLDLESTDLFLDFFAFDFNVLTPNQVLGLMPFTISHLTSSVNIEIFSISIDPLALTGINSLQVMLQDIGGNLADTINIDIMVRNVSNIDEPSTVVLLFLGKFLLYIVFYRRRMGSNQLLRLNS